MPRLFALSGPDVGRSFEVASGAVLGRAPDCEVRLADRSVSRRHARIEEEGGRWFVADLGSRNGVRVGGERVERVELADHDELVLGELALRFRTELPAAEEAPPAPAYEDAGLEIEEEIELEEELDLAATAVRHDPRARPEDEGAAALSERELARARILAEGKRTGLFAGDLEQHPGWVRLLLGLLVVAFAAALAYGAFLAVTALRGA